MTLIFTGYGLLVNIMTEYRDWPLIIPLVLTGLAIDLIAALAPSARTAADARRHPHDRPGRGRRAVGLLLLVVALDKGIGWEPTMWVGALHRRRCMTGFGVAFLVAPPSYGPRLVGRRRRTRGSSLKNAATSATSSLT